MSDAERNAVDNLMLLCPNHHREIDRLQPAEWPPERLMEVKANHEAECARPDWASDATLEYVSSLLASEGGEDDIRAGTGASPRLVIQDGPGDTFVVANVGTVDAFDVSISTVPGSAEDAVIRLEQEPLARLSPGGRWKAGLYAATMGTKGSPIVRVTWRDRNGERYDAEFPL